MLLRVLIFKMNIKVTKILVNPMLILGTEFNSALMRYVAKDLGGIR